MLFSVKMFQWTRVKATNFFGWTMFLHSILKFPRWGDRVIVVSLYLRINIRVQRAAKTVVIFLIEISISLSNSAFTLAYKNRGGPSDHKIHFGNNFSCAITTMSFRVPMITFTYFRGTQTKNYYYQK